jgi:hypothetical protein
VGPRASLDSSSSTKIKNSYSVTHLVSWFVLNYLRRFLNMLVWDMRGKSGCGAGFLLFPQPVVIVPALPYLLILSSTLYSLGANRVVV